MAGGAAGTPGGTGGSPSGGRGQRLVGIDVARAVAIIGMFMVHMGPTHQPGVAGALYALPHGRASVLFVLLAGVGVSLLARSALGLGEVRRRLAWRAAVLFPLGLGLQALEHRVLVILPVYAALFVLAMLAVAWDDRRLLRLAAACGAVGPVVFLYGRITAPAVFSRSPLTWDQPPWALLHGLVLSGPYPLVVWAAPFLVGMWLGRQNLRAAAVRALLVAGGLGAAAGAAALSGLLQWVLVPRSFPVTWAWMVVDAPHSQMPLWLVASTGAAAAVMGVCLEAGDRWGPALGPLAALGKMALTVYAGHLVLLDRWRGAIPAGSVGEAAAVVGAVTALALVFAAAWQRLLPAGPWSRGPLEALVRWPGAARRPPPGQDGGGGPGTNGEAGQAPPLERGPKG
ncbi:MAG TPA: heparan-alpha-glucosaminide N-acetyltransferase domain-containing protein [Limnochordales bacterium]|nr:heparan-alpha-glucosaminide N-acetyltransferase domain-containing protein [Limnochordales bacterium]